MYSELEDQRSCDWEKEKELLSLVESSGVESDMYRLSFLEMVRAVTKNTSLCCSSVLRLTLSLFQLNLFPAV